MKTIFLDFDGVLFDSQKEAYLLARYAFYDIPVKEAIDDEHYQKFRKYRYLITHSWHYYYILKLIENNTTEFKKEYYELINNRNTEIDSLFDEKYQKQRKLLIENDYNYWKTLEQPYGFFYKIQKIKNDFDVIILSTKNEFAIRNHLNDYDFKLKDEKIIGKEKLKKYRSKSNFIENYIKSNKIEKAIFIDDSIDNLKECRNTEHLQCIQAKWGYVEPQLSSDNSTEIINLIKEL